jgi:hypothetical protein
MVVERKLTTPYSPQ